MSKQKITEQELLARVARLQEHMNQSVEESWWSENMPELLGGDPAKAPMKMPVTPKNYARIQKMLPAMYAAAQVDPNADEIVKQRFGVYLPPYEQWDGTVPSGRGDFLTRNVFGRDGAAAAEVEGTKAQQAEVVRQQRVEANAKKLTDLYAQLKELVPSAFQEKTATPAAPTAPVKESLAESMKRLSLMITEAEVQPKKVTLPADGSEPKTQQYITPGGATFTGNAPDANTAPAGHPAEAVIKEIEATIAAIEADDPDEDDLQVINAIKEKIAQSREVIKQETKTAKPQDAAAADPTAGEAKDPAAQAAADRIDPGAQAAADARQDAEQSDIALRQQQAAEPASAGGSAPDTTPGAPQAADAQKMINTTWNQIYDLNKSIIGDNPNLIKPGQKFELPNNMGSYTVVPGDTLSGIAAGQGKGKYETNVPPTQTAPNVAATNPPFKKELSADDMKAITGVEYGPGVDLKTPFSKDLSSLKPATKLVVHNGKTVAVDDTGKILGSYDGESWKSGPALPPELQNVTVSPSVPKTAPPLNSTNGTYKNLDVSDPRIKALQAKVANDPNNASFNATVREDQTLARIVSLVNYGK